MLRLLKIDNLAIIEHAELELDGGFSVLTGETGAGKTLVVGAIELLLGGRADSKKVRTGTSETNIEGKFDINGKKIEIRRKITASGRSYAWINDSPVNISELESRTAAFADLLGQHEHQELLDPDSHIGFLDSYAGNKELADSYREDYELFTEAVSQLKRLDRKIEQAVENARLREFELRELTEAGLDIDELESIDERLRRIEASERILASAGAARDALTESNTNALSLLTVAEKAIRGIHDVVEESAHIIELIETAQVAVSEASRTADEVAQSVDVDPEEAEQFRGRQALIQRLCRKYNRDVRSLIIYRDELEKGAENIEELKTEREKLQNTVDSLLRDLTERAKRLSQLRRKAAPVLASDISKALVPLGMDNVRFRVDFKMEPDPKGPVEIGGDHYALLPTGAESVEFLISPNPGEELRPLASIVSGGELSRIMLALKTLIIDDDSPAIMVFDEVDTGIGGDVGHAVGEALAELAKRRQLLVITHLPQIARRADSHFVIEKLEEKGRTKVNLRKVKDVEQKAELARMHGEEVEVVSKK
ncbi:DNA repair protein RecN [bacterium]|nr:MAG: DNA repair protein RecN [bacterium]